MKRGCFVLPLFSASAVKPALEVDGRRVEYEISGNLTISDSLFAIEAALDGIGLAYVFEALARP